MTTTYTVYGIRSNITMLAVPPSKFLRLIQFAILSMRESANFIKQMTMNKAME